MRYSRSELRDRQRGYLLKIDDHRTATTAIVGPPSLLTPVLAHYLRPGVRRTTRAPGNG